METVIIPHKYVRQRVGRPRKYFTEDDLKEMRRVNSETNYREHPEKKIEQVRKYRADNLEKLKEKAKLYYQKKKEKKKELEV
jgi:hypothetical protein